MPKFSLPLIYYLEFVMHKIFLMVLISVQSTVAFKLTNLKLIFDNFFSFSAVFNYFKSQNK